jgi:hypothetical protein
MEKVAPAMPDHNSTGKGAFIVGLIGLVLAFVPIIGFVSWLLAPLALLMGLFALRKPPRGLAIAGVVTGGLALLICFWWIGLTKSVGEAMNKDTFTPTGVATSTASAPIMDATIGGIWDDMEANKIAAGSKYGGHRLRFTDVPIEDFHGDAESPAMTFVGKRDEYLIHMVSASFAADDGAKIGTLEKGQKVTFVCDTVKETFGDGYSLSGCVLQ